MIELPFQAILFDMDGVLVDSNPAIEASWRLWADEVGAPFDELQAYIHGRKAVEVIAHFQPGADIDAVWSRLIEQEMANAHLTRALPGAAEMLASLERSEWTIVTSAPEELALARLAACGLPTPHPMISARDVARGKPAPDGFLKGAEALGCPPSKAIVIEDSAPGIAAALAGGMAPVRIQPEGADPDARVTVTALDRLEVIRRAKGPALRLRA